MTPRFHAPGAEPPAVLILEWWASGVGSAEPATDDLAVARGLLVDLVGDGRIDLPLPGHGSTWARFEALITLGELDLTLGRLAEAHTDAIAILAELDPDAPFPPGAIWGVWAAEPPNARVEAARDADGAWRLDGRKAWCSGAGAVTHALVTAHAPDGPRLFAVDLRSTDVRPVDDPWPSPALIGTDTRSVDFREAVVTPIGEPNDYIERPGFWHGAVGVAAVWHGGALGLARSLERRARDRHLGDIGCAHLGAVTAALAAGDAVLRRAAVTIDAGYCAKPPFGEIAARSVRAVVEGSAGTVLDRVGRALGPTPLAMDREHARRVQDLQLYLRQSHADADLAELGRRVSEVGIGR